MDVATDINLEYTPALDLVGTKVEAENPADDRNAGLRRRSTFNPTCRRNLYPF